MIELEVAGKRYSNFTTGVCSLNLDSLCNSFQFTMVAPDPPRNPVPFKADAPCRVFVDGILQLTGFIENMEVNYSRENHTVIISGRDKPCDLLDSTLNFGMPDLSGDGVYLWKIIEDVLAHINLDISVIRATSVEPFSSKEVLVSPEPGLNCFKYIEAFAKMRRVLLTSDPAGNIVIARNNKQKAAGRIQHRIGARDNNVLNASFKYDGTKLYGLYLVDRGSNPLLGGLTEERLVSTADSLDRAAKPRNYSDDLSDFFLDGDFRQSRQLIFKEVTSGDTAQSGIRCLWENNVRQSRSTTLSVSVPGFRVGYDSGDLWNTNRLYDVVDDFLLIDSPMLCRSVNFQYSKNKGSETTLSLIGPDAYTTDAVIPQPSGVIAGPVEAEALNFFTGTAPEQPFI